MKTLSTPILPDESNASDFLRVFAVEDDANFLVSPIFDSMESYAQIILDLCVQISCKVAEATDQDEEVALGRILDCLLSEAK